MLSPIDNIIENITIYYGYKIIDDIKLIQKPSNISLKKNKKIEDNLELTSNLESQIGNIKDTELKDILIKLGKEIIWISASENSESPRRNSESPRVV